MFSPGLPKFTFQDLRDYGRWQSANQGSEQPTIAEVPQVLGALAAAVANGGVIPQKPPEPEPNPIPPEAVQASTSGLSTADLAAEVQRREQAAAAAGQAEVAANPPIAVPVGEDD